MQPGHPERSGDLRRCRAIACLLLLAAGLPLPGYAADMIEPQVYQAGVAAIDITPEHPIRLNGFGMRREESSGVRQRIWAKALAVGSDSENPALLITVDILGIPDRLVTELATRLERQTAVRRDRLAVTATHTHSAPMLEGENVTIFGEPIPDEHLAHIDRYTEVFINSLEQVALDALADRKPSQLSWGIGRVGFAKNRRTGSVPVDHDLPLLVVRSLEGSVRGLYFNYACHCVTLSDNQISGDWAGYAQEAIQRDFPGAIALCSVGCGADSNPTSGVMGDRADVALSQGEQIAGEIRRLLAGYLSPVHGPLSAKLGRVELPLQPHPTREQWLELAKLQNAVGHHARAQLARLDRGEALIESISAPVQSWKFGDSLAIVFLPGETVVDYSLRLKRELDAGRLWVNGYSNASPGYIPSERVLSEGGYEGRSAMTYYDIPGPYAPGLEQKIVDSVHRQLGPAFTARVDAARTHGIPPLSPQQSAQKLRTRPEMVAELMVAEPLVIDPVAIDFGPDGRLWVAEMHDYPEGLDGAFAAGGRIRVLEDTNGDGRFDRSTVFLDGIPFPTGVTVWREGVLVCAAPDILYAEDTDGDGRADVKRVLYSGFGTDNYQARVNSLCYGLDGWVYGSCGLFGGNIASFAGGEPFALGDRDFRIQPDVGTIEPASGRTQQGRVRDDWGQWLGCSNSSLAFHHPLADHYLRRNPHIIPPSTRIALAPANRLYPIVEPVRFKLSGAVGQPTAACGLGVYRDDLLGPGFTGNTFTCEPVSQVVHRLMLAPEGVTFSASRAADEGDREFLASADQWFRPVQARTGPDGALWVVDMYRYVIEHPRWIPPESAAAVDLRAGHNMGRIYRVFPRENPPRPIQRLDELDAAGLVAALDTPNGPQRDLAAQMLVWKQDRSAIPALENLAASSARPATRMQALCVLYGLDAVKPQLVMKALGDDHAGVRCQAVRIAERHLGASAEVQQALLDLVGDADPQVRLQLACTLGEWNDSRAAVALVDLAVGAADDRYITAAVLSSVGRDNVGRVVEVIRSRDESGAALVHLYGPLARTALGTGQLPALRKMAASIARANNEGSRAYDAWQLTALAGLLDAVARSGKPLEDLLDESSTTDVRAMLAHLRALAANANTAEPQRAACIAVLGRLPQESGSDLPVLRELLAPRNAGSIQMAAVAALARLGRPEAFDVLIDEWRALTPPVRAAAVDAALERAVWAGRLLDAVERQQISASEFDPARVQRFSEHPDERLRNRAGTIFNRPGSTDRQDVLENHRSVYELSGDAARGGQEFARTCASCHQLGDVGHAIGPDLSPLANKPDEYLLLAILDPNRAVDNRYFNYAVALADGRTVSGMLTEETATSITLTLQENKRETILRSDIEELASTGKSLMPEGLERDLTPQQLADVLAFLRASVIQQGSEDGTGVAAVEPRAAGPEAAASPLGKTEDVREIATKLLDPAIPVADREALVAAHLEQAGDLIAALTENLPSGQEEYRRIPWIWRLSIAAGKRNDDAQLREILSVSLPGEDRPLRHWQAVVIGGGIVNGISQLGLWPRERIAAVLAGQPALEARWTRVVEQSSAMADDERVPAGTRYDALRILGCGEWKPHGEQLLKYLASGTNAELQMGAVSGLVDVNASEATRALVDSLTHLTGRNRDLALDGLLRTPERALALLDAVARADLDAASLGASRVRQLREHSDEPVRRRAAEVLRQ